MCYVVESNFLVEFHLSIRIFITRYPCKSLPEGEGWFSTASESTERRRTREIKKSELYEIIDSTGRESEKIRKFPSPFDSAFDSKAYMRVSMA